MGNVTVGKYDFNDEAFDNVSSECIDFITKLLVKEHGERMTAKEALRHKWVKRKPQYQPTAKPSTSPHSFKASYTDKVRKFFLVCRFFCPPVGFIWSWKRDEGIDDVEMAM
jgi:serine/threonine protein kinase